MLKNKSDRPIRCPECFSKDMDVFLHYDEDCDEHYCCKCCFTGGLSEINNQFGKFIEAKYKMRF